MSIDKANIFSFAALPTEIIPFDETTLNVIIRDLPKSYPFDIVLFDGSKHTFQKEIELYDFLLIDYYETFNQKLEEYRQKLIDDARIEAERKAQEAYELELKLKHDAEAAKQMQDLIAAREEFKAKYGDADEATRNEIDKEIFINATTEQFEIKKHNDRVRRQLNNKFEISLANYDSKYLPCEINLFDKLRVDALSLINNGVTTMFLLSYFESNYRSTGISIEELAAKIIQKAEKRDSYISQLIATMKEDLKKHIKE